MPRLTILSSKAINSKVNNLTRHFPKYFQNVSNLQIDYQEEADVGADEKILPKTDVLLYCMDMSQYTELDADPNLEEFANMSKIRRSYNQKLEQLIAQYHQPLIIVLYFNSTGKAMEQSFVLNAEEDLKKDQRNIVSFDFVQGDVLSDSVHQNIKRSLTFGYMWDNCVQTLDSMFQNTFSEALHNLKLSYIRGEPDFAAFLLHVKLKNTSSYANGTFYYKVDRKYEACSFFLYHLMLSTVLFGLLIGAIASFILGSVIALSSHLGFLLSITAGIGLFSASKVTFQFFRPEAVQTREIKQLINSTQPMVPALNDGWRQRFPAFIQEMDPHRIQMMISPLF